MVENAKKGKYYYATFCVIFIHCAHLVESLYKICNLSAILVVF